MIYFGFLPVHSFSFIRYSILFVCLTFSVYSSSSQTITDSLKTRIASAKEDSNKVNLLNELAWELRLNQTSEVTKYLEMGLQLAEKIGYKKGLAYLHHTYGSFYYNKSDYPLSLFHFFKSLEIMKQTGDKIETSKTLGNIGNVYLDQQDYTNSLKYYFLALDIDKGTGRKNGIATNLSNIGLIYYYKNDYSKALKNFFEAYLIMKEIGNQNGISTLLGNIGNVYYDQGDYDLTMKYYFEALEMDKNLGNITGVTRHLGNIGLLYFDQKKYNDAEKYFLRALHLADSLNYLYAIKECNLSLSDLYFQISNWQPALIHYRKYSSAKDSLFSEEKSKTFGRLEQKHEFEMAELQRKQEEIKNRQLVADKVGRRNLLQYSGISLILVFLLIIYFLLTRRFRKIQELKVYSRYIKIIEATLFISFLIFFEFILVFVDPFIEKITGGAPAYKLLLNVTLAMIIFPLHSYLEAKLKIRELNTELHKTDLENNNKNSGTVFMLFGFILISLLNFSFTEKTDSLRSELKKDLNDTIRINVLNNIAKEYFSNDPVEAFNYAKQALLISQKVRWEKGKAESYDNIARYYWLSGDYSSARKNLIYKQKIFESLGDKKGVASSLANIGVIFKEQGDYPNALINYFSAIKISKELGYIEGIIKLLGNIGTVYMDQGDFPNALKYYFEAMKISNVSGEKHQIAVTLGNIGNVYINQGELANALKYYFKALEIDKELNNKFGISRHLGNIGIVYRRQGDNPNALKYFSEALAIDNELENNNGIARHLSNIGNIYFDNNDYKKAMSHFLMALEIHKRSGNKSNVALLLGNIGTMNIRLGNFVDARKYLDSALAIDTAIGSLSGAGDRYESLSRLYDTTGNWKLAYNYYKKYCEVKDSLFNDGKSKEIGRLEEKHEFEMAEFQRKQEEVRKQQEEIAIVTRRNTLQYSGISLLLVFLFLSIFLLARRFRKIKENKVYVRHLKIVEATLFISFLIFFEFILVFIDPFLENTTGGEPAYKLLVNVLLAVVIYSLHNFLEAKLKTGVIKAQLSASSSTIINRKTY